MVRSWTASLAALIVGDATSPNMSLSAQVHRATLPGTLAWAFTHAADPPSGPGLVTKAPCDCWLKLAMKPLGETPDRFPPMNRIICGV
jgi:hypothetical protein